MKTKQLLPALAALFSFSIVALSAQYIGLLFPAFTVPFWLWLILLTSSLESAYYATYYLNRRTPILVRFIELGLWLLPVYFLCGRVIESFLWPGFLVLISWLIARGYGSQLAFMERVADYLGDQGASTVSWEYESLASTDYHDLPIKYFWSRLYACGILIALLAIAFHNRGGSLKVAEAFHLTVLGSVALVSGLALQAGAYLFRLQILWGYAQADVSPSLTRRWIKGVATLLLLVLFVVNVAPVNYWPLTAQRISAIARGLLIKGPRVSMPPMTSQDGSPQFEGEQDLLFPEEVAPGPWGIILALSIFFVFAGLAFLILFVLGFIVVHLVGAEVERLKGLPKLAVQIYSGLQRALCQLFHAMRNARTRLQVRGNIPDSNAFAENVVKRPARRRAAAPENVRIMLRRIAQEAGKKGLVFHPALTPSEYGRMLMDHLPEASRVVDGFFAGYHKVRYSNQEVSISEQENLLEIGADIITKIENLRGDESHGKVGGT